MALHGHRIERSGASPVSKCSRTEAGASSSMSIDCSSNLDLPPSSSPRATGPVNQGLQPPFDGDNLAELLRQEKIKNEALIFQIKAFTNSSSFWSEQ